MTDSFFSFPFFLYHKTIIRASLSFAVRSAACSIVRNHFNLFIYLYTHYPVITPSSKTLTLTVISDKFGAGVFIRYIWTVCSLICFDCCHNSWTRSRSLSFPASVYYVIYCSFTCYRRQKDKMVARERKEEQDDVKHLWRQTLCSHLQPISKQ